MEYIDNKSWNKIKNNIINILKKYDYFILSICNDLLIDEEYNYKILSINDIDNNLINLNEKEIVKRLEYINYVRSAYNRLSILEKKIIFWTYLDKNNNYDDCYIANELGFSLGYYYVKKKETLIRYAYALGIGVFNE